MKMFTLKIYIFKKIYDLSEEKSLGFQTMLEKKKINLLFH